MHYVEMPQGYHPLTLKFRRLSSLRSMAVCRAGRMSGEAAKFARKARENERFLCPRPPLLLSAPNQNRHATQAKD